MSEAQPEDPTSDEVLAMLHRLHGRLTSLLSPLDADQVGGPSYDDDWTIAQVASHLGSGAEIFELCVAAGLTGGSAPGMDRLRPIWDVWNAKSPTEQAADALSSDARFLAGLDALTDQQRDAWVLEMFGGEQSLASMLRLRAAEHAIHTWDIAVALDPTATVADDAVELIVDTLPWIAGRAGKPSDSTLTVDVRTTGPERSFVLELSADATTLAASSEEDADSTADIHLPAEALVRLVYGRLDPDHTPASVEVNGVGLDVLRRCFPGF